MKPVDKERTLALRQLTRTRVDLFNRIRRLPRSVQIALIEAGVYGGLYKLEAAASRRGAATARWSAVRK